MLVTDASPAAVSGVTHVTTSSPRVFPAITDTSESEGRFRTTREIAVLWTSPKEFEHVETYSPSSLSSTEKEHTAVAQPDTGEPPSFHTYVNEAPVQPIDNVTESPGLTTPPPVMLWNTGNCGKVIATDTERRHPRRLHASTECMPPVPVVKLNVSVAAVSASKRVPLWNQAYVGAGCAPTTLDVSVTRVSGTKVELPSTMLTKVGGELRMKRTVFDVAVPREFTMVTW
jgi:hypothetical protein